MERNSLGLCAVGVFQNPECGKLVHMGFHSAMCSIFTSQWLILNSESIIPTNSPLEKSDPSSPGCFHPRTRVALQTNEKKTKLKASRCGLPFLFPKFFSGWFYFQVAKFPFKSNVSFVVIVPNQITWDASHVLQNFPYKQLCRLFPREVPSTVKIPKIKLDYQLELNQVLSRMGKASSRVCTEQEEMINLFAATLVAKAVPHSLLQNSKLSQLFFLSSSLLLACLAPNVLLQQDDTTEKAAPHSFYEFFLL